MAKPRVVSRSGKDVFKGYAWNAMINLCAMEPLDRLTPTQRIAALAFWYMSEVNNGGHFQYFVNKRGHPHQEVVHALESIGAHHSANVLRAALKRLGPTFPPSELRDAEHYLQVEEEVDLSEFDFAWGEAGNKEVNQCLESHLQAHEREFVEWIE